MNKYLAKEYGQQYLKDAKDQMKIGGSNKHEVDWNDFNYPPILNLFHYSKYDLAEDSEYATLDSRLVVTVFIAAGVCCLNLIDNIILACVGVHWVRIVYSVMNMFLVMPVELTILYKSHKAIVSPGKKSMTMAFACQIVGVIGAIILVFLPLFGFNGALIPLTNKYHNAEILFDVVVALESIAWSAVVLFSLGNMKSIWDVWNQHSNK